MGFLRWDLKGQYDDALDDILGRCEGEDVSFVAINTWRDGDYFVYIDKSKLAIFQVSEAFNKDIEDVLLAQGVRSKAIARRKEKTVPKTFENAPDMPAASRGDGFLNGIVSSVGVGANLVTIGATLAGLAACSVM